MKKLCPFFLPILLATLLTCGIDDYKYLDPVEPGNIVRILNTQAFIRLPNISVSYFRNFVVYYRIYISGNLETGFISPDDYNTLNSINTSLYNDYRSLFPYTNSNNSVVPANMDYIFAGRRYYMLHLSNGSIDNLLGTTGGGYITLDFAQNTGTGRSLPALFMGDTRGSGEYDAVNNPSGLSPYPLFRHSDADSRPFNNSRYFINNSDLNDPNNIKEDASRQNWDVARNTNEISGDAYTYVSMYIMSYGIEDNFSPIFSIPTFIGIFRLP